MATEQWQVAKGVEPVIGTIQPFVREEAVDEMDERVRMFEEWFGRMATPWEFRVAKADMNEDGK